MASNKDSKTSKTAHVMNLLSKNRNVEPPSAPQAETSEPEASAPQASAPAAPAPAAPIPPIISSINADAAVSSQIRDALEAALLPEEAPARPAVQTPPAAPAPKPEPPVQAAPPQQPAAEPVSQPAPAPAAPAAPAPEPPRPHHEEYEPPAYVNVMEVLVKEKAEKYMRATGMCCCDRCMVDVMAYTLNHLPPKYVVMSKGEMIPKLTFYEVQNSSDITAKLMRACEIISKAPHHGRG